VSPEARRLASPLTHLSAATKPILIIQSDDDKSVPIQQAVDMVEKLKASGVRHKFVHYTDRGHMGITDDVVKEARAFIARSNRRSRDAARAARRAGATMRYTRRLTAVPSGHDEFRHS
jgi:acetyl esterase/lipase